MTLVERHGTRRNRTVASSGVSIDDPDKKAHSSHHRRLERTRLLLIALVGLSSWVAWNATVVSTSDVNNIIQAPPHVNGDSNNILPDTSVAASSPHPRILVINTHNNTTFTIEPLYPPKRHREIDFSTENYRRQKRLGVSKAYRDGRMDPLERGDCKLQYDWQTAYYPTCNLIHEHGTNQQRVLLGHGLRRNVYKIQDSYQQTYVLKMLRFRGQAFEERNFERHRKDAIAAERLTSSPFVVDIYSFCGDSGIFEYANGGDMEHQIFSRLDMERVFSRGVQWNSSQKLTVAHQVASAVADLHSIEDRPSIVHADIMVNQFVNVNGNFKLTDFDRSRFLTWNPSTKEICGFHVGSNPGRFRSPEEYRKDAETEKVDVFSLGNMLYVILTGKWPFPDEDDSDDVAKMVRHGKRPPISRKFTKSKKPQIQTLLKAIEMCWIHDPKERATARQVADVLQQQLNEMGG